MKQGPCDMNDASFSSGVMTYDFYDQIVNYLDLHGGQAVYPIVSK